MIRVKDTNEHTDAIKLKVVKLASKMFRSRGVKDVKMDEIASALSMSKRTIYELFNDKESLLIDCMQYSHEKKSKETCEIVKSASNVLEVILLVYAHSLQELHETNLRFFQDVRLYPRAYALIGKRNKQDFEDAVNFFKQGVDQGIFRSDINFEIFIVILHKQIDTLLNEGVSKNFSFFDVYEFIMFTFLRGVSTRKGQDIIEDFIENFKKNINSNLAGLL